MFVYFRSLAVIMVEATMGICFIPTSHVIISLNAALIWIVYIWKFRYHIRSPSDGCTYVCEMDWRSSHKGRV